MTKKVFKGRGIKDLTKVKLNNEDVLLYGELLNKDKGSIILPENISKEVREEVEGKRKFTIIAKGVNVITFDIGDILGDFKGAGIPSYALDSNDENTDTISVVHMNNLGFVVTEENFDQDEFQKA